MGEFEIIERFFAEHAKRQEVVLGIGDDAALVMPPENNYLVVTTDTMVEGVHFFSDIPPNALGFKALATNLSDLAAMGAEPRWVNLALTLPNFDEQWLTQFCEGFFELAEYYNVTLIGGDTTRGPLSITVTAQGVVPTGRELTRHGAKAGDWVYVTGNLGASALALKHLQGEVKLAAETLKRALSCHYYPQPRVLAGYGLREVASACIDVSDGLLADLTHILNRSKCGARLMLERLPIHDALGTALPKEQALALALSGGEDYELCFTVPEVNKGALDVALSHCGMAFTCIGQLNGNHGQIEMTLNGKPFDARVEGWQHF
jgi:thiamine-monophosphate kinase